MTGNCQFLWCLVAIQLSAGVCAHNDQTRIKHVNNKNTISIKTTDNNSSSTESSLVAHPKMSLGKDRSRTRSEISSPDLVPKIVGGNDVSAGEYPWYSALYRNKNGSETNLDFYCGGTLISPSFVLTGKCNVFLVLGILMGVLWYVFLFICVH
jgi:hypothetical protein